MQILQHYYGSKINLFNAPIAEGDLESFPGQNLQIGSTGKYVNALQQYINKIAQNYPEIGKLQLTAHLDLQLKGLLKIPIYFQITSDR